jgi:hypothetical protein
MSEDYTRQKFRKRLKPQNTVYSVQQEAIIKAIYDSYHEKICHSEKDWTKKDRKSPFSGCQAIWEYQKI